MKILILLTLVSISWASSAVKPIKTDLEALDVFENERSSDVITRFIPMPLDHFNPISRQTFLMRYITNEQFLGGNDHPIFIFVGGQWPISEGWVLQGNMFEMAKENKGLMVYLEHRYYGETQPFLNPTLAHYRFLNTDQAIADLAVFISMIKGKPRFTNSQVILYGPSYAGNMVMWFQQRFPHLAVGAIASGAPIKAQMEFPEYLEMVEWSLRSEGGDSCINIIGLGIHDLTTAMTTPAGRQHITTVFNLCNPLTDNVLDQGSFSGMLTRSLSGVVETAVPGTIIGVCDAFQTNVWGNTEMEKLAGFLNWRTNSTGCHDHTYQSLLNVYRNNINYRSWLYQTCTEFGYFQTAPSTGTIFDSLKHLNVNFFIDACRQLFSNQFTFDFVRDAVDRMNTVFGGLNPSVSNTINIHGELDPWRALGVHEEDLSQTSPTYNIPRASHIFDIMPWLPTNTILMTNAQQRIRRTVTGWLNS